MDACQVFYYDLSLANAIIKNPTQNSYKNTSNLESYFSQLNYDYNGIYYLLEAEIPNSGSWWIENSDFQRLLNGGEFIKQEYTFEPRKCVKELRLV